jgi:hypothetical protein
METSPSVTVARHRPSSQRGKSKFRGVSMSHVATASNWSDRLTTHERRARHGPTPAASISCFVGLAGWRVIQSKDTNEHRNRHCNRHINRNFEYYRLRPPRSKAASNSLDRVQRGSGTLATKFAGPLRERTHSSAPRTCLYEQYNPKRIIQFATQIARLTSHVCNSIQLCSATGVRPLILCHRSRHSHGYPLLA